jgi:hypothetical protein
MNTREKLEYFFSQIESGEVSQAFLCHCLSIKKYTMSKIVNKKTKMPIDFLIKLEEIGFFDEVENVDV